MVLAIMQPYIFPYPGYFHLIQACDTFVFYDDVNFIKQGWINRNRLQLGDKEFVFTIPLDDPGSFKRICDTKIHPKLFPSWKRKFFMSLDQSYKKAPYFTEMKNLATLALDSGYSDIADICRVSIMESCAYLGISKNWVKSSQIFKNDHLKGVDRVLDICNITEATHYINAPGGKALYDKELFLANHLKLSFVRSKMPEYLHHNNPAIPGLSILDLIAWNSPDTIRTMLLQYNLE
jgi:hypothetical protein